VFVGVVVESEIEFLIDGGSILRAGLFEDADQASEGICERSDFASGERTPAAAVREGGFEAVSFGAELDDPAGDPLAWHSGLFD
jgi:hypothetical protein